MAQPEQDKSNNEAVDLSDLHEIITGLRQTSFTSLDPEINDVVQQLIKTLPQPESLYDLVNSLEAVNEVKGTVSKIMEIVDHYGLRDIGQRERFKSRKKLPPRYKVLEMRPMQNAADTVKLLVRTSESADNKGFDKIASETLKYVKMVQADTFTEETKLKLKGDLILAGMHDEISMLKEAGFWGDIKQTVKDVGGNIQEVWQSNRMPTRLQDIMNNIATLSKEMENMKKKFPDNSQFQDMYKKLSNMYYIGQEVYNLADDEGTRINPAVIDQPEVQTPKQQQNQTPEQQQNTELMQWAAEAKEALRDEGFAQSTVDGLGDVNEKSRIKALPGETISQKLFFYIDDKPAEAADVLGKSVPFTNIVKSTPKFMQAQPPPVPAQPPSVPAQPPSVPAQPQQEYKKPARPSSNATGWLPKEYASNNWVLIHES